MQHLFSGTHATENTGTDRPKYTKGGKLRAGPIWDFNLSCGRDVFGTRSTTDGFQFNNDDNVGSDFWYNLFNEPNFYCQFYKRWNQLTLDNNPLNVNKINEIIDSLANVLHEAKLRDDMKWNSIGYQNQPDFYYLVENSISDLKHWFNNRILWLSNNLINPNCNLPFIKPLVISKINYNPKDFGDYKSNDLEFIELTNNSENQIDVSGYYFKNLGISYVFPLNSIIYPNQKIYLSSNAKVFKDMYKINSFGEYTRNLSNTSFELLLTDAFGNTVDSVSYKSTAPWPSVLDNQDKILTLTDLNCDNSLPQCWELDFFDILNTTTTVSNKFKIYPIPTNNEIKIESEDLILSFEIYDELGRILLKQNDLNLQNFNINLSQFTPNIYFLKTTTINGQVNFSKLIKN